MNKNQPKHPRVLAIAPSTRGFGFAVVEGQETLVDWGVKSVQGDKNTECIAKVKEMIAHYQPGVLVLEDASAKDSRRSLRIRGLTKKIIALASSRNVTRVLFSREQIKNVFFPDGEGTKHALAERIANRFPEELGFRLPPKRQPWMSEDYRMNIFEAISLAVSFGRVKRKAASATHLNKSL